MNIILLLAFLIVLIGILPILIWGPGGCCMPGMMGYGWWFMPLIPLIFLVLIVLGAYYIIMELFRQGRSKSKDGGRALEILKERYARGEITREEYLKMKEELES